MENQEYLQEIIQRYITLGFEPQLIPRHAVKHLRGSHWCMDLKNIKTIDTVAILAQKDLHQTNRRILYTFEYALRGNIKGIQSDRTITHTDTQWKGIFRKTLITTKWITPEETDSKKYMHQHGTNPRPGEIYEGGPHMTLANNLNKDDIHMGLLKQLLQTIGGETRFIIYSDKWDESIRLACNIWTPEKNALQIYTSPLYLDTAQNTLGHILTLRKQYGGLTF